MPHRTPTLTRWRSDPETRHQSRDGSPGLPAAGEGPAPRTSKSQSYRTVSEPCPCPPPSWAVLGPLPRRMNSQAQLAGLGWATVPLGVSREPRGAGLRAQKAHRDLAPALRSSFISERRAVSALGQGLGLARDSPAASVALGTQQVPGAEKRMHSLQSSWAAFQGARGGGTSSWGQQRSPPWPGAVPAAKRARAQVWRAWVQRSTPHL